MFKKPLITCFCLAVAVAGCEPQREMETWEKREQVHTDKTPQQWIELIRHRNATARRKAVEAIIQYGDAHVPALIEILEDKTAGPSRLSAARALGGIGAGAKAAVPALCKALGETGWVDRDGAAKALGDIRQNLQQTIPALVAALKDSDERVRGAAARALGRMQSGEGSVVSALAAVLEDEDSNVKAEAAEALQRIGPKAQAAIPALKKAAKAEDFIVSQAASEALKRVQGE